MDDRCRSLLPRGILSRVAGGVRRSVLAAVLVGSAVVMAPAAHAASGCQFLSNPGAVSAFCDTFDAPAGTGNRSGDLNGTVWGVSRETGAQNPASGMLSDWFASQMNLCGTTVTVSPENDWRICNGHLVDAVNDGGHQSTSGDGNSLALAAYPKQPFDIAGRTGTVVFDVSDDTHGPHAAWPEFWWSDQPLPVPNKTMSSGYDAPRNGLGIRLEQESGGCVTAGSAIVSRNYDMRDSFTVDAGAPDVNTVDCVQEASAANNTLNHFEIQFNSANGVATVYGTNPFPVGGTPGALKELSVISFGTFPLTRGVIWIDDDHYNACKDNDNQCTHTFYWDNVGFDGPVLPQDRTYDVLDANHGFSGDANLGWNTPDGGSLSFTTLPVEQSAIDNATGALLTFNAYSFDAPGTIKLNVNGHEHDQPWPYSFVTFQEQTIAFPINVSDVVAGPNQVSIGATSDALNLANIDIILIGGGGSCGTNCPPPPPPPSPTPTPPPPTPTPTPPPSGPALGTSTVEPVADSDDAGSAEAFSAVAKQTTTVNTLHVYATGGSTLVAGIYSDNAGKPGTLLAQGSVSVASGWNAVPLSAPVNLVSGTKYWIVVLGQGGSFNFRDANGGVSFSSTQSNLTTLPSSFSTGAQWASQTISAYADEQAGGAQASPKPQTINNAACTVGGKSGMCSGTFTPAK